ncbi:MAG: glycosyl hydrolase family 28-related protein [Leptolyngbyaceae cyanobacterium MO_188.B28]|nr:glycosyl hydrolase family 28-related protein [Leptolyngbyaceae cyanobacterium MO_188.B28]
MKYRHDYSLSLGKTIQRIKQTFVGCSIQATTGMGNRHRKLLLSFLMGVLLILVTPKLTLTQAATNENIVFPSGADVVNVKEAPYFAKGDGVTDDTTALQNAISENRLKQIYIPNGTYLVSDTVDISEGSNIINKRFFIQGQSQAGTILKLKDNTSRFGGGASPTPVLKCASGGGAATAFRNMIRNITVDTGQGNPEAIGLRFSANNYGVVEHVTLRSSDSNHIGDTGLELSGGPLLVKNVAIDGFDTGLAYTGALYSATVDGLTLSNQGVYGIYNKRQVLSIRNLVSDNSVPAIKNDSGGYPAHGLLTLVGATLNGGAANQSAIENTHDGGLYVRDLTANGYQYAISNKVDSVQTHQVSPVNEFVSHPILSAFNSPQTSLGLPIEETPESVWDPLDDWAVVDGAAQKDDTAVIQAAIDSGKTTIYFPKDTYKVSSTIEIRGNVQRLLGVGAAKIEAIGNLEDSTDAVFRIVDGAAPVVIIENFESDLGKAFGFEHASSRTLVLKHLGMGGYRNLVSGNQLFIENVSGWRWYFKDQQVWATQLNPEASSESGRINIENDGADLWLMGVKTERDVPVITTKNGGRTELLGGFLYGNRGIPNGTVGFLNNESSQSLVFAGYNSSYKPYIRDIRGGVTKDVNSSDMYAMKYGKMSPLFVGYEAGQASPSSTASSQPSTGSSSSTYDPSVCPAGTTFQALNSGVVIFCKGCRKL